jgi:hypothetical protein
MKRLEGGIKMHTPLLLRDLKRIDDELRYIMYQLSGSEEWLNGLNERLDELFEISYGNYSTSCSILMAEFESVKHQIENIRTSVKAEIEWQKERG